MDFLKLSVLTVTTPTHILLPTCFDKLAVQNRLMSEHFLYSAHSFLFREIFLNIPRCLPIRPAVAAPPQ